MGVHPKSILALSIFLGVFIMVFIFLSSKTFVIFSSSDIPLYSSNVTKPPLEPIKFFELSNSPSCTELDLLDCEKPLDCVEQIRERVQSLKLTESQTNHSNILLQRLTVRNRYLYQQSQLHNNIIQSQKDIRERMLKHHQCVTNVTIPTLAICAIQRGTSPYIQEWLSYYLMHGVSKFFLYDNSIQFSTEGELFRKAVKPFVEAGFVDLRISSSEHYDQNEVYNGCIAEAKKSFDWIAFFDIDEYLVINEPGSTCIPEFLIGYQEFPGLHIKWRMFTPKGVMQHNYNQTFLEQYRWNDLTFGEGKSILQTKYEGKINNPHILSFEDGKTSVCPDKTPCGVFDYTSHPFKYAELRHYWGVDWGFSFFVKLCGGSPERNQYISGRSNHLLRWLYTDPSIKVEGTTRQEINLKSFLFD